MQVNILGKYMNYHWRIKPIKLALWAPKVHCQTKRNANEESKQAKLVQCKVFGREVMKAGITTNHHLTPQYLEDMSHDDEVVHLQCSSYSIILNKPIDMGCNNLVLC